MGKYVGWAMPTKISRSQFQLELQKILSRMKTEATVFPEDTDEARRGRREKASTDKLWFLKTYLPHYFDTDFAEFHKDLVALSGIRGTPSAVAAPRGHGKSALLMGLELHSILFATRHFLIIASATEDVAIGHTTFLRLELEENPRIIQDFGELRGGYKWEEGDFITRNNVRVLARGIGQKVRGIKYRQWRPQYFRLDDMEDDASARNPKRVKKALDWVSSAVIPAGQEAGLEATIIFVGTNINRRSVLDNLLHHPDYSAWCRKSYPALLPNGQPLWPQKYSLADLGKIKGVIGTKAWQSEMMQEPRDEEGDFQEGWIRYYHPAELQGLESLLVKTLAIDPSIKETSTACYKAIITVGMDPEGIIYVLDAFIRRCSINQMIESAYLRHTEFGPKTVGLETVAGQEFLLNEFNRTAAKKGYHLPLVRIEQKENKEVRIKGLGPLVELGVIRFQKGHSDQNLLIEQLLNFPSGEIDGPDALEMAIRLLRRASMRIGFVGVERRRFAGRVGTW